MFEKLITIIEKEIKLNFRYKINYLGESITNTLRLTILFLLVYFGLFSLGFEGIEGLNSENFIPFILLGGLISSFFILGIEVFSFKFLSEKYWQTFQAILIAPINKFNLLFGIGLAEAIRLMIIFLSITIITYLIIPTKMIYIFAILLITLLTYFGILGVGLTKGAITLSNENYIFVFELISATWIFLSCLYYPINIFPKFIQKIILLNPIYHSVTLIRELWYGSINSSLWTHLFWVLGFAIIFPIVGVYLFNKTIKNFGIKGY